jgi:hypothetical protein
VGGTSLRPEARLTSTSGGGMPMTPGVDDFRAYERCCPASGTAAPADNPAGSELKYGSRAPTCPVERCGVAGARVGMLHEVNKANRTRAQRPLPDAIAVPAPCCGGERCRRGWQAQLDGELC